MVINIKLLSASSLENVIDIKRCWIFLRIFLSIWKICRKMSTYLNAHANGKKWIFDIKYPGNWFEFSIDSNDFWSSTIWAIQIRFSFNEFENPKNPEILPIHQLFYKWNLIFKSKSNRSKSRNVSERDWSSMISS